MSLSLNLSCIHRPTSPVIAIATIEPKTTETPLLLLMPEQQQRKRRRVRFSESATLFSPSYDGVDVFPAETFWYSPQELEDWRAAARQQCRSLRRLHSAPSGECTLSTDPTTRGLEQRACMERQRRRFLVIKWIAKKASKTSNADALAALAQQCTLYATDVAAEEAARDFYHAYGKSLHLRSTKRHRHEVLDGASAPTLTKATSPITTPITTKKSRPAVILP